MQQKRTRKQPVLSPSIVTAKWWDLRCSNFDEDYEDPNDRYWLWRFMIDERYQRKGYGTATLKTIIEYFRDHGANNIRLSTKPSNTTALNMYRKAGFRETGEIMEREVL